VFCILRQSPNFPLSFDGDRNVAYPKRSAKITSSNASRHQNRENAVRFAVVFILVVDLPQIYTQHFDIIERCGCSILMCMCEFRIKDNVNCGTFKYYGRTVNEIGNDVYAH
jgi:hypothetical protein